MAPNALHPLERALLSSLRGGMLLPRGSTGLASVSGGADSTALLLLLDALRGRLGIALEVLHFDHGLRPESAAESEWVRALAARLGLPFHLRGGFAGTRGGRAAGGTQARARTWRRRESLALLRERGAGWIATGHQREDQWETLLLKLLRGAHLSRLQGMAARQGAWVRPLLGTSHAALEGYLRERGQDWLEDPSNRSPAYRRNRVRHELLPLLESLTPGGIGARLETLERHSRALAEWIAAEPTAPQNDPAREPHWIDAQALRGQPRLLREAQLHAFLAARMPGLVDAATLERAAALIERDTPWTLHLSARRTLLGRGRRVLLERRDADVHERLVERERAGFRLWAPEGWDVGLAVQSVLPEEQRKDRPSPSSPLSATSRATGQDGGQNGEWGWPLATEDEFRGAIVIHNLSPGETPITVRPRQAGDRIELPGEAKAVKVADVLRNSGVPLWERERVPVVQAGEAVVAVFPDWIAAGHEAGEAVGSVRITVRITGHHPEHTGNDPEQSPDR